MLGLAPIVGANVSISCGAGNNNELVTTGHHGAGLKTESGAAATSGAGLTFLSGVSFEGIPTASLVSTTGGTYIIDSSGAQQQQQQQQQPQQQQHHQLVTFAMSNHTPPPHQQVASHCDVVTSGSLASQRQPTLQLQLQQLQQQQQQQRLKIETSPVASNGTGGLNGVLASSLSSSGVAVKVEPTTMTPGNSGVKLESSSSSKNGVVSSSSSASPRVFYIQTKDGQISALPDKLREIATQQVSRS